MRRAIWPSVLLATSLLTGVAQAACRLDRLTSVAVTLVRGLPLVEAAVDGKPATFVLDTGAERTVLADTAVRELGLPRDKWVGSTIGGVGGVFERSANATLRSFELGGVALRRRSVNPVLSLAVAPLPLDALGGRRVSGLLGADYLSAYDLDLDLRGGVLALVATRGCEAEPIPWEPAHGVVPLARPRRFTVLAPVRLDGRVLQAQLDTGASLSVVSKRGMARLGIGSDQAAPDAIGTGRGVGRGALALRLHRFTMVGIGPVETHDVTLALAAPVNGYPFDMLLGTDLLSRQRLFISYATNRLLIASEPARLPSRAGR